MARREVALQGRGLVARRAPALRCYARCARRLASRRRSDRPGCGARIAAPRRALILHRLAMRILITRPREDAEPFAQALIALGHEAVIEPLLEIFYLPGPALDLVGVQAILLTSASGARAVALRTSWRDIAIVAVGPATANAAREVRF